MSTSTVKPRSKTAQAQRSDRPAKMSVMGVGGKIAIPLVLYTAAAGAITRYSQPLFRITEKDRSLRALRIGGSALAATGFSLNLVAAFEMLKANKEERLATGGLYRLFRDPMYTAQIFITLPGLFLLSNSWLVLSGVIPTYIAYRVFVREEHAYLEEQFGEAYSEYLKTVLLKV
jgi:protein-S-isoprenylcysteine O-methyltransferase Ste14